MAITITLADIKIHDWTVEVDYQRVIVSYSILKDTGEEYLDRQTAIFWRYIPDPGNDDLGNPIPVPDNWYQLPEEYVQMLTDLTLDARSALLHLVNE